MREYTITQKTKKDQVRVGITWPYLALQPTLNRGRFLKEISKRDPPHNMEVRWLKGLVAMQCGQA